MKRKGIKGLGPVIAVAAFVVFVAIFGKRAKKESMAPAPVAPPTSAPAGPAAAAPQIKLDVAEGWTWTTEGGFSYVRGSVRNTGQAPIGYFEVEASYLNAKGEPVETDYTNSGDRLDPGATRNFEIMHRASPDLKKVTIKAARVSPLRAD